MRHAPWFSGVLLLATLLALGVFLYLVWHSAHPHREVLSVAGSAVVSYAFMRGVHMQFLLWIWHALPFVLMSGARLSAPVTLAVMVALDWCHAWVSNVVRLKELVRAVVFLVQRQWSAVGTALQAAFTQLPSAAEYSARFPVRMLGRYYAEGFSYSVVPASLLLCVLTLAVVWRLCYVLAHQRPRPTARAAGDTRKKAV